MKKKNTHRYPRSFLSILIYKPLVFLFLIVALPISLWAVGQNQQLASLGAKPVQSPNLHTLSVSGSKLGVFLLGASDGGRKIVVAGPRVIKVIDPQDNSDLLQIVRDYKAAYPDGIVVARVYEGDAPIYGTNSDPDSSAQDWWNKLLGPAMDKLDPADKKLITYLSGPNEYGNTPIIKSPEDATWTGKFWAKLAQIISDNGFRPLMGEIPVGNLDGNLVAPLVPTLRTIKSLGGAWSYHAYSDEYTTDPNVEIWYSLRYRQFYDYFKQNAPDLSDMPMILTEGGIDHAGNGKTDGWNGTLPPRGDRDRFINWLTWFDNEIKNDPYIVGVTLFQIGNNTDWSSFNLESISDWLTSYLGGQPETNSQIQLHQATPAIDTFVSPSPIPTVVMPTSSVSPTVPVPTITSSTQPSPTPQPSPTAIIITSAPTPTSTPIPTLTPTLTPAPFVDVAKTVKNVRSFWSIILIKLDNITKQILP